MGGDHRAAPPPRIVRVRGWGAFAPWQAAWERLCTHAGANTPWHQSEWLAAAWSYPGQPVLLALLTRDSEILAGVAFCRRWESGGLVRAPARGVHCLPHLPYLYPTCNVAVARPDLDPREAARLVRTALAALSWDVLLLSHFDAHSRWLEAALRTVVAERSWTLREQIWSAEAVLEFDDGPDAYWATRSGHMRRKLNAGERTLAARGTLRFADLATEKRPWPECWNTLEDIYRRSWQAGAGLSPFDAPWGAPNRDGLEAFHRRGQLHPVVLRLDDTPIAFDLWLASGSSLYGLARGMDPAHRDSSAGGVLARRTIEYAHTLGFRRKYLGPVNDQPHFAYKHRWLTRTDDPRMLVVARPRSWYGRLDCLLTRHPGLAAFWSRHRISDRLRTAFDRARRLVRRQ